MDLQIEVLVERIPLEQPRHQRRERRARAQRLGQHRRCEYTRRAEEGYVLHRVGIDGDGLAVDL